MGNLLRRLGDRLGHGAGRLQALSPLDQLSRGYVIASRDPESREVLGFHELAPGSELWLRFHAGRVRSRVEEISE
jgi:exonuclease VII large subunit